MLPRTIDMYRVLPELVWSGFGVLVMLMQPFVRSRHFFTFLAMIGTLAGTAAAVTAAMHAGPCFGAGVAHRVHRLGDEFDLQLHSGGIPPRFAQVDRIGDEVFPAGLVRDGVFPLRDRAGVWIERNDDADQNGLRGASS